MSTFVFSALAPAEARPVRVTTWGQTGYFHYYMEHPTHPHVHQWKNSSWTPRDWTMLDKSRNAQIVVEKLKHSKVIYDIIIDEDGEDVPVVEVGPAFYKLGGQEKRRMAAYIDHVYNFTNGGQGGIFYLNDARKGWPIGIYTKHGLQLQ